MEISENGFRYEIIRNQAVLKGVDPNNKPELGAQKIPAEINGCCVVGVGSRAFFRCDLKHIILPETIYFIGEYAFAHSKIESVIITESSFGPGFLEIGSHAFENCMYLTSFWSSKYLTIAYKAFDGCINLNSNNSSFHISVLGADAFKNCFSVRQLFINSNALLKQNCFRDSAIKELHVYHAFQVEDGVINDLRCQDILVITSSISPVLDLSFMGVKVTVVAKHLNDYADLPF